MFPLYHMGSGSFIYTILYANMHRYASGFNQTIDTEEIFLKEILKRMFQNFEKIFDKIV